MTSKSRSRAKFGKIFFIFPHSFRPPQLLFVLQHVATTSDVRASAFVATVVASIGSSVIYLNNRERTTAGPFSDTMNLALIMTQNNDHDPQIMRDRG